MSLLCSPIGKNTLNEYELREDREKCLRFGSCGAGSKALYLSGRFLSRRFYILWDEVDRVYKRVAISKGGFTGKGVFASVPFLIVEHGGNVREFIFKHESDIDNLLHCISAEHPNIPVFSEDAEKRLYEAEAEEKSRYLNEISAEAEEAVSKLKSDSEFLNECLPLANDMVSAARNKRVVDNIPSSFRVIGVGLALIGIIAVLYGLHRMISHQSYGLYFIAGGAVSFFVSLSSNALPTKWNSRKEAELRWRSAVDAMKVQLEKRPEFVIPAQYAHPTVLTRIIRVIREGRAEDAESGLEAVKEDLKALNSSVSVSRKEYDEVVEIKPLFLVCDYKNELQD